MSSSRRPSDAAKKRQKRRGNRGSFKPGPDPRRHVFTRQECWVGYAVTYVRYPHLREWLKLKVILSKRKDALYTPVPFTSVTGHEGAVPDTSFSDEAIPF